MYITGFPALDSISASCYRKFYPEINETDFRISRSIRRIWPPDISSSEWAVHPTGSRWYHGEKDACSPSRYERALRAAGGTEDLPQQWRPALHRDGHAFPNPFGCRTNGSWTACWTARQTCAAGGGRGDRDRRAVRFGRVRHFRPQCSANKGPRRWTLC